MGTLKKACKKDYDYLESKAIAALNKAAGDFLNWVELVRDPEMPWTFRWSSESFRGANVGATSYILGAAWRCGVLDQILSDKQKRQGTEWIKSLMEGENMFIDPNLLDRKPPGWDDKVEAWPPDGAHKEAINQYAKGCLKFYEDKTIDDLAGTPPPAWPQKGDTNVLDWIKKVEPNWSWIGRMVRRLILWYHEGAISEDLLVKCMNYVYTRQDKKTGFWGGGIQPTFKVLITIFDPAEIEVPNATKIIDAVLRKMEKRNYNKNLFPCEEFDAFYDIALAWTSAPGYREDEIKKLAAYRICYILETHTQADRGLSSYTDHCNPTWLKWDMAPPIPQGDAFGWGIYASGLNICVDIIGIADRVSWTGKWRARDIANTTPFVEMGKSLLSKLSQ